MVNKNYPVWDVEIKRALNISQALHLWDNIKDLIFVSWRVLEEEGKECDVLNNSWINNEWKVHIFG